MTNSQELRQKIDDSGLKFAFICEKLGVTYATLRRKIRNENEFTASEIVTLTDLLHLSDDERNKIFFALEMN